MASAPPPLGRYHRQIAEARERALVLVARQEEVLVELLRRWASELTARVTSGVATVSERRTLEVVRELIDDLVLDLASSTRDGIGLTASEMEGIHTRATRTLLEDVGRTTVAVGLEGVGTRAAQAVLARPELTTAFVTLREEFTDMAETAIREAVLRGQSPDQLARRLRLMMVGSEGIPDRLLLDQRRIGRRTLEALGMDASPENVRAVRREARRVRMRAERIARTEIRTAEHESGVRLAAESPVVSAIQWFLSNRHPAEDICDDLATVDWWGLGTGVHPPERVPGVPHPLCLCGRRHVLLPPEQFGLGRGPVPSLRQTPGDIATRNDRAPSESDALRRAFEIGQTRTRVAA